jgi:hypothetical protein
MNRNENQSILNFIQDTDDQAVANGIQSSVSSYQLLATLFHQNKTGYDSTNC